MEANINYTTTKEYTKNMCSIKGKMDKFTS